MAATSVFSAPLQTSQEWEKCAERVPTSVEMEARRAGVEEWIVTKLWGQTQRGERVKQNDCSQLFAIMQKYISQGRPYGLFRMGDATRVSVQELLGQKTSNAFDADCIKAGQSKKTRVHSKRHTARQNK